MPAESVIRGLKGAIDFYYYKGIPCARKWPRIPMSSRTPASMASAALFGEIVQLYGLLDGSTLTFYQLAAQDQTRSARDLMVSGVLGGLHQHT